MEFVFLSYSRKNKDKALEIRDDLAIRGVTTWIDMRDIQPGSLWSSEIEEAIRKCSIFLVILSPQSVISEYVLKEIAYAFECGKIVIPALISDCDVPESLLHIQYVDLRVYREGISRLIKSFPKHIINSDISVEKVQAGLLSPTNHVLKSALLMAGSGKIHEVLNAVIAILRHPDPEMRAAAAIAIDRISDHRAISALVQAINDPVFDVRSNAGWALVHLGEQVVPEVIEVLKTGKNADAREMAYLVLRNIGSSEALNAISHYWRQ